MTSPPPSPSRRLGVGSAIVVVLVALVVTVAIGILRGANAPVESVVVDASATPEAASLYVHVSGAVVEPGLYVLRSDARAVDAISAAGGFAADAEQSAINLARPLSDGEQLVVPVVGAEPAAAASAAAVAADGRVNLNTADVSALDTLPRIGPAIAQRIIDWRDEHGRFTSVEDLLAVPGIGEKMLAALRDLVTV